MCTIEGMVENKVSLLVNERLKWKLVFVSAMATETLGIISFSLMT